MGRSQFANIQLFVFVTVALTYFYLKHHFSGVEQLRVEVAVLKEKVKEEELKVLLSEYQQEKFRQYVAANIPEFDSREAHYPLRNLASISRTAKVEVEKGSPSKLISDGKELCEKQEYQKGQIALTQAIESFPLSPQVVEAHFLVQKCFFDAGQIAEGVYWTDIMVQRFPESELTGLALLRSGDAYLERNRMIDAKYVLEMVKANFREFPQVVTEANKRLREWQ